MLSLAVPLPLSGEHDTKSRSHSDWHASIAMVNRCISCHGIPVRDANTLGHLDGQVHPSGELESRAILSTQLIEVQVSFWLTAIFADIAVDLALLISSAYSVLTMRISNRRKISATLLLSLRSM
jgi:hypothetical protein